MAVKNLLTVCILTWILAGCVTMPLGQNKVSGQNKADIDAISLGDQALQRGDTGTAALLYRQTPLLSGQDRSLKMLAVDLAKQDMAAANQRLARYLSTGPARSMALEAKARTAYVNRDFHLSAEFFGELSSLFSVKPAKWRRLQARSLDLAGDYAAAGAIYRHLDLQRPRNRGNYNIHLALQGRFEQAMEETRNLITTERDVDKRRSYQESLAMLLAWNGQIAESRIILRQLYEEKQANSLVNSYTRLGRDRTEAAMLIWRWSLSRPWLPKTGTS